MADIGGSILGGLGNVLGGILGSIFSSGDRAKANQAMKEAVDQINQVGAPPDLAKQIIYDKFKQVGLYTPQLEQAIEQNSSELANLKDSTEGRNAQLTALQKLQGLTTSGETAEERAAMNGIRSQAQRDIASKNKQIIQNLQQRGQAGSGAELAATLLNSQEGTQREANQADQVAADANRRALQAIQNVGQLGGQVRAEDVNVNSTRAKAQDELNRFNITNKQNVNQRNTASMNTAQQQNLAQEQKTSDVNTAMNNQELLRQKDATRQFWQDRLNYSKEKAAALTNKANVYNGNAATTASTIGGVAKGVGDAAASIYKAYNETPTAHTNGGSTDDSLSPEELEARRRERGF